MSQKEQFEMQVLQVLNGDPNFLVKRKIEELGRQGWKACDRLGRRIAADEGYKVATEELQTIHIIPVSQGSEAPEANTTEGPTGQGSTQDIIPEPDGEPQKTDDIWGNVIDLIDSENDNMVNVHLGGTEKIKLIKGVRDSHGELEWTHVEDLLVPINDPQGLLMKKMGEYWQQKRLKPYDSEHRRVDDKDCYDVAMQDKDRVLRLMESWQDVLSYWDVPPPRQNPHAPPETQEKTEFPSTFTPELTTLPQLPTEPPITSKITFSVLPLVESTPEEHKDKKRNRGETSTGMTFLTESESNAIEIRHKRKINPPDKKVEVKLGNRLMKPRDSIAPRGKKTLNSGPMEGEEEEL
jgi:hypothetical protein